jgi:hypothetical protein
MQRSLLFSNVISACILIPRYTFSWSKGKQLNSAFSVRLFVLPLRLRFPSRLTTSTLSLLEPFASMASKKANVPKLDESAFDSIFTQNPVYRKRAIDSLLTASEDQAQDDGGRFLPFAKHRASDPAPAHGGMCYVV